MLADQSKRNGLMPSGVSLRSVVWLRANRLRSCRKPSPRELNVHLTELALQALGARAFHVVMPTPPQGASGTGPVDRRK